MKEFLTNDYKTTKRDLEEIVDTINTELQSVDLDKVVIKAIEGKSIGYIINNVPALEMFLKTEKVQHLPTFTELLMVGVDLRANVKLSDLEVSNLKDITKVVAENSYRHFDYSPYIQFSKGKALINLAGLEFIEGKKVKMNKQELELFTRVNAVIEYAVKDLKNPNILDSLFKYEIVQDISNSYSPIDSMNIKVFDRIVKNHSIGKK